MFGVKSYATGMPVIDAQDDYRRARRAQMLRRVAQSLTGRSRDRQLPALAGELAMAAGPARLEVVELSRVVGTLETKKGFDAKFRPASEIVRRRWERIAHAHRAGKSLPPISVVRSPDGYYVVDGCHRVSVARALGHRDIDAWVRTSAADQQDPAVYFTAARAEAACA